MSQTAAAAWMCVEPDMSWEKVDVYSAEQVANPSDKDKPFTVYKMVVTTEDRRSWEVSKTFAEFVQFREQILANAGKEVVGASAEAQPASALLCQPAVVPPLASERLMRAGTTSVTDAGAAAALLHAGAFHFPPRSLLVPGSRRADPKAVLDRMAGLQRWMTQLIAAYPDHVLLGVFLVIRTRTPVPRAPCDAVSALSTGRESCVSYSLDFVRLVGNCGSSRRLIPTWPSWPSSSGTGPGRTGRCNTIRAAGPSCTLPRTVGTPAGWRRCLLTVRPPTTAPEPVGALSTRWTASVGRRCSSLRPAGTLRRLPRCWWVLSPDGTPASVAISIAAC